MNIITLLNEKGGCGKSTLSVILATELARRGFMTLLVDADSQGHATLGVRAKRKDNLHSLLLTTAPTQSLIVGVAPDFYENKAEKPLLWVIPSSSQTSEITAHENWRIDTLQLRLRQIESAFDYVIIDTSPSITPLHNAFYEASDYIIFPTECTYFSMQGLFKSLKHMEVAQAQLGAKCAQMLGIVPSKFDGRESVQHQNYGYLRGKYGDDVVFSPIRRLTAWEQASQLRVPVTLHEERSQAAKDAVRFVGEVLERLEITDHASV